MTTRGAFVTAAFALLFAAPQDWAQAPSKPAKSIVPRTPDGHPDLQGTWNSGTLTPLERPDELANKPTVSDQEALGFEKKNHLNDPPAKNATEAEVALDKAQKAVGALQSDFW